MQLYAETLQEIIDCVKSESRAYKELRTKPRIGLTATVTIRVLAEKPDARRVRVRDISQEGMGLIMSKPLRAPARFVMSLPKRDGAMLNMVCQVCHCEAVADGIFAVGVTFVSKAKIATSTPAASETV